MSECLCVHVCVCVCMFLFVCMCMCVCVWACMCVSVYTIYDMIIWRGQRAAMCECVMLLNQNRHIASLLVSGSIEKGFH